MDTANKDDIIKGLKELGLEGKDLEVHSSLSSFGQVNGGAATVIDALKSICGTILMPTYSSLGRTGAPKNSRPLQNGTDYKKEVDYTIEPYNPKSFSNDSHIEEDMGIIPRTLLTLRDVLRSKHPSVSWAGCGDNKEFYLVPHPPDDPNRPLKKLAKKDGYILLIGVDLRCCTAVHLAEESAGRKAFIRWVLYDDGKIHNIREYGCSEGFNKLAPYQNGIARKLEIGSSILMAYPMNELLNICKNVMSNTPEITHCGNSDCERCNDAVKGGPIVDK